MDLNFDELQLLPMTPDSFGSIAEVPKPLPQFEVGGLTFDELTDQEATVAGPGEGSFP